MTLLEAWADFPPWIRREPVGLVRTAVQDEDVTPLEPIREVLEFLVARRPCRRGERREQGERHEPRVVRRAHPALGAIATFQGATEMPWRVARKPRNPRESQERERGGVATIAWDGATSCRAADRQGEGCPAAVTA